MSRLLDIYTELGLMRQFFIDDLIDDIVEIANEEIVQHSIHCCFGCEMDRFNGVALAIVAKYHQIYIDNIESQLFNLAIDSLPETFKDQDPEVWEVEKIIGQNIIGEEIDLQYKGKPFAQAIYEGLIS